MDKIFCTICEQNGSSYAITTIPSFFYSIYCSNTEEFLNGLKPPKAKCFLLLTKVREGTIKQPLVS